MKPQTMKKFVLAAGAALAFIGVSVLALSAVLLAEGKLSANWPLTAFSFLVGGYLLWKGLQPWFRFSSKAVRSVIGLSALLLATGAVRCAAEYRLIESTSSTGAIVLFLGSTLLLYYFLETFCFRQLRPRDLGAGERENEISRER